MYHLYFCPKHKNKYMKTLFVYTVSVKVYLLCSSSHLMGSQSLELDCIHTYMVLPHLKVLILLN